MKATFSLPDHVFEELAALAEQRHESRSSVVAEALARLFREQRAAEDRTQLAVAYPPNEPLAKEDEALLTSTKRRLRARIESGEWEW